MSDREKNYGYLTPDRLQQMMDAYDIASYQALQRLTGVPQSKVTLHMQGKQPLGPTLRRRLGKLFKRKREQHDIFMFPDEEIFNVR